MLHIQFGLWFLGKGSLSAHASTEKTKGTKILEILIVSFLRVMIGMENQNPKVLHFGVFSHNTSLVTILLNNCLILDDSSSNNKQTKLALLTRVPEGSKVFHGHLINYEYIVKRCTRRNAYFNNLHLVTPYCR